MEICIFGQLIKLTLDTLIAVSALLVSIIALGISIYFWKKSFRPIVTAMVKTHSAGNEATVFDLEISNSGTLPARNIRLRTEQDRINAALGNDAGDENKRRWLSCFEEDSTINILHNNEKIRCSFGLSRSDDRGFWKYKAKIPITIEYEGWFGKKYIQNQEIQIMDSDSFTGFMWN